MVNYVSCSGCGKPQRHQPGMRPAGQTRCMACRSANQRAKAAAVAAARVKPCKTCGVVFTAQRAGTLYCGSRCQPPRVRKSRRVTTNESGYGWEHQKTRRRLLDELVEGSLFALCPFCGEPMTSDQRLDLDHSDPDSRWRGEPGDRLAHAVCNRKAGARRAAKPCECYVCSGEHAVLVGMRCRPLRRRLSKPPAWPKPKPPKPKPVKVASPIYVRDCARCEVTFTARRRNVKYCGQVCSYQANLAQMNARYRDDPEFRAKAIEAAKSQKRGRHATCV